MDYVYHIMIRLGKGNLISFERAIDMLERAQCDPSGKGRP
jgi:hypothetical protein